MPLSCSGDAPVSGSPKVALAAPKAVLDPTDQLLGPQVAGGD
jgi:hypothetical protein